MGGISNASIQNIYVNGNISKKNIEKTDMSASLAGISGWAEKCTINNCVSDVDILANNYGAAGILGRGNGIWNVINCVNLGKIENKSESTGGIIGRPEGATHIYNCYNTGKVIGGTDGAGGIIGDIVSSQERIISNVYNIGNINMDGGYGAGGIIGQIRSCNNITVDSAYNIGKISGKSNCLGAICAYIRTDSSITISNSVYVKSLCNKIVGNEDDSLYEGVTGVDKLTGEELVEKLNANAAEHSDWKKWKLGTNGYPTFLD